MAECPFWLIALASIADDEPLNLGVGDTHRATDLNGSELALRPQAVEGANGDAETLRSLFFRE
jgi:hypothetical protein